MCQSRKIFLQICRETCFFTNSFLLIIFIELLNFLKECMEQLESIRSDGNKSERVVLSV